MTVADFHKIIIKYNMYICSLNYINLLCTDQKRFGREMMVSKSSLEDIYWSHKWGVFGDVSVDIFPELKKYYRY